MKKNINNLCRRGFAWVLTLAMCLGTLQVTAFAEEGEGSSPPASESSGSSNEGAGSGSTGTTTVDVSVNVSESGEVSATVTERPSVEPSSDENKSWSGEGSADLQDGVTAEATVNGSESSETSSQGTPVVDADGNPVTDADGNPVFEQESGTIKGEETIEVSSPEVPSPDEPENPGDEPTPDEGEKPPVDHFSGKAEAEIGSDGTIKDSAGNLYVNLEELAEANRPKAPEGFSEETSNGWESTGENSYKKAEGNTTTEWSSSKTEDGKGWVTTETITTKVSGQLDPEKMGWSTEPSVTTTPVYDSNGNEIGTITTTVNPKEGTYESTFTKVTKTMTSYMDNGDGKVSLSYVSITTGYGDGKVTSYAPGSNVLGIGADNQDSEKNDWFIDHILAGKQINNAAKGDNLKLLNMVLQSTVFVNGADGNPFKGVNGMPTAWLREIKGEDGTSVYVYCVDKGPNAVIGTEYELVNLGNRFDNENAKHIQYIIENGYWGADSGKGSLEELKKLLTADNIGAKNLFEEAQEKYGGETFVPGYELPENEAEVVKKYQEAIDDGLALAVTQAALWYWSNPGIFDKDGETIENIFTTCWTKNVNTVETGSLDTVGVQDRKGYYYHPEQEAAMALFKALIQKDTNAADLPVSGGVTDIISKEDIKGTSIEVTGKVSDEELEKLVEELAKAETKDDKTDIQAAIEKYNAEKGVYKTNVSLTVAVVKDSANIGDMKVVIYADGVKVKEEGLSGLAVASGEDGNTTFTVKDVILPNGAKITMNLAGTQDLGAGAYLFRSDIGSQTMSGYVTGGKHNVNIDVDMDFHVTAPTATTKSEVTVTQTVKETRTWGADWERTYASNPATPPGGDTPGTPTTPPDTPGTPGTPGTPSTPSTPTVTVPDSPTPLADSPIEEVTIPDEDVPLADTPEEIEIDDPEVPLSSVPMTGDTPIVLYAAALFCVCGLTLLKLRRDAK